VGLADRLNAGLRHAEVLDLAFGDQVFHRSRYVFHRYVRVDTMLVKKIDPIRPQPFESLIGNQFDALRTAIQAVAWRRILEPELGGNHDVIAEWLQRLANNLFVGEGAIGFRRVEKSDAAFKCGANERNGLLALSGRPIAEAQPHAAQANSRDLQAAFSEFALLHGLSFG